ncbi:hypothetical protein GJAV_G00234570 [Gymnothorax javanicus]|nr:hypothetical protein GJAV_G00234570 [Gymnothorax javanicus]
MSVHCIRVVIVPLVSLFWVLLSQLYSVLHKPVLATCFLHLYPVLKSHSSLSSPKYPDLPQNATDFNSRIRTL